jgi:hypothetical protein
MKDLHDRDGDPEREPAVPCEEGAGRHRGIQERCRARAKKHCLP